ncbi:MAG: mechanosensitive ion channel family protein [Lachnospiraceae bacterium]|nr:mechanosensitive ion channel family protein [Lachnospiraceae bacterium]
MVLAKHLTDDVNDIAKNAEESAGLLKETLDSLIGWLVSKTGSVIVAIIVILAGMKLVSMFLKLLKRSFERSKMEESVAGFLLSAIRIMGYILVFLTAATVVGFEVTSFVTILGTASLSIGLALQGALSNLAGGVLILALKPFQIGDYIIENNKNNEGTVVSIDIFYTRLCTPDNRVVVIPNGILADNSLVNLTNEDKRRVEIKISIAYNTDMQKVKKLVYNLLNADGRILQEEPKDVFIDSFDDSGMTLGIRAWVSTNDYWPVTWELREQVKKVFDSNGIEIPYNRVEVDMLQVKCIKEQER